MVKVGLFALLSVSTVAVARAEPPATDAPAVAVTAAASDTQRQQTARANAELGYRQEAISFGDESTGGDGARASLAGVAYQGDIHRALRGRAFYETVGREDLAAAYTQRRTIAVVTMVG